jgi:hypothetical protein
MSRAKSWVALGLLLIIASFLLYDFLQFISLDKACASIEPVPAFYCGWDHIACHARPGNCTGNAGDLASDVFYFDDIVPVNFTQASVIGYGWMLIEYIAAVGWDLLMFGWFVIKQPLIINPPVWAGLVILWNVLGMQTDKPAGPLDILEGEKALGDAGKAAPSIVHQALVGASPHGDERFKD